MGQWLGAANSRNSFLALMEQPDSGGRRDRQAGRGPVRPHHPAPDGARPDLSGPPAGARSRPPHREIRPAIGIGLKDVELRLWATARILIHALTTMNTKPREWGARGREQLRRRRSYRIDRARGSQNLEALNKAQSSSGPRAPDCPSRPLPTIPPRCRGKFAVSELPAGGDAPRPERLRAMRRTRLGPPCGETGGRQQLCVDTKRRLSPQGFPRPPANCRIRRSLTTPRSTSAASPPASPLAFVHRGHR